MDGNGSLMEVEGGWKWKVDGSGSMEIVVDGPNEPPYCYEPSSLISWMSFTGAVKTPFLYLIILLYSKSAILYKYHFSGST